MPPVVTISPPPLPTPPSPTSTIASPRTKTSRRASLVNAKLSGVADSFIERGRVSLSTLRLATESKDVTTLFNEVNSLKAATASAQATRVRNSCVALQLHCDNALQMLQQKGAESQDLAPAFWDATREHLARLAKELGGFERSVEMARAPKEETTKQNKYTYEGVTDEKEHEKQLLSWNKEVYEGRVAKAFVQEKLLRTLYQQQVQHRSTRIYHQHQELVRRHQECGETIDTPYNRRKSTFRATEDALLREIERTTPCFRDLEQLTPRLHRESLARRGIPQHTGMAEPASMRELTRNVELPPLASLMNPRNQMTSPLPEKDTLLPPSPRRKRADEEKKTRAMYLPTLLKFIAVCFEEKRAAEAALQKEMGPVDVGTPAEPVVVPLKRIIDDELHREHGSSEICAEKFQQLKISCGEAPVGHGAHPRVAIFRRMAGWDGLGGMLPVQEAACVALLSWLGIATDNPHEKDVRMLMRLKDINRILDHLHRVRLLPERAREFFIEVANELRLPRSELPRSVVSPMVDADALVWGWMERWGGWEYEFERDESSLLI